MDILIISDSHGHGDRVEGLLQRKGVTPDALFFLGDGLSDLAWCDFGRIPVYRLRGNCDYFNSVDAEDEILTELNGKIIFAAHGHRYSVKNGYETIAAKAASVKADILLFGHTHEPLSVVLPAESVVGGVKLSKSLHILNPGSIGCFRSPSFGTVVIRNGCILTSCTFYQ